MDVTKAYEFIGFGAMDVTKPYEFIGFGAMDLKNMNFLNWESLVPEVPRLLGGGWGGGGGGCWLIFGRFWCLLGGPLSALLRPQ